MTQQKKTYKVVKGKEYRPKGSRVYETGKKPKCLRCLKVFAQTNTNHAVCVRCEDINSADADGYDCW